MIGARLIRHDLGTGHGWGKLGHDRGKDLQYLGSSLGPGWGMVGRENCNSGGMVGARGMIGARLRHGLYKVYIRSWFI